MNKKNLNSLVTIVTGPIGIIDASLVRFLEKIKENSGQLLVHVKESIYNNIIPKSHLYEFLKELAVVDGIVEDEAQLHRILPNANTTLIDLPQKELEQYSLERILKRVNNKETHRQKESNKLTGLKELISDYGSKPYEQNIKLGLVSGSFDLIHLGHVRHVKAAKDLVDVVVVAAMSTSSIQRQEKNKKGDRPIYSQEDRVKVLSALKPVDLIVVFDETDCKEVIRILKPGYFFKHQRDMPRQIVKEECELVERLGGKVVVTKDDTGYSSTDIIHRLRSIKANRE